MAEISLLRPASNMLVMSAVIAVVAAASIAPERTLCWTNFWPCLGAVTSSSFMVVLWCESELMGHLSVMSIFW